MRRLIIMALMMLMAAAQAKENKFSKFDFYKKYKSSVVKNGSKICSNEVKRNPKYANDYGGCVAAFGVLSDSMANEWFNYEVQLFGESNIVLMHKYMDAPIFNDLVAELLKNDSNSFEMFLDRLSNQEYTIVNNVMESSWFDVYVNNREEMYIQFNAIINKWYDWLPYAWQLANANK